MPKITSTFEKLCNTALIASVYFNLTTEKMNYNYRAHYWSTGEVQPSNANSDLPTTLRECCKTEQKSTVVYLWRDFFSNNVAIFYLCNIKKYKVDISPYNYNLAMLVKQLNHIISRTSSTTYYVSYFPLYLISAEIFHSENLLQADFPPKIFNQNT